jgi:carbon-monoxide dehydrogenase large subunit
VTATRSGTGHGAGRFVGQSVKRREDLRLIAGRGSYVDDVRWPGMLHVAFLRSPIARGVITRIDVTAARQLPGVRAVYTGADVNGLVKAWYPTMYGPDSPNPPRRLLAYDDVRYAGEQVAMVVAESRYLAEDAVDLIELDIEPQPAIIADRIGIATVAADTQNLVHPEFGTNLATALPRDANPLAPMPAENAELEEILRTAPHVLTETFVQHRYNCVPMETRGMAAKWDPVAGTMLITSATQSPHEARASVARLLGINESQVRAVSADVGGGFGQKMFVTPEEYCVAVATFLLAEPVRWIEDRQENLLAGGHARREEMTVTMATDADGYILAMKAHHAEDSGAYPVAGLGTNTSMSFPLMPGPYDFGQYFFSSETIFTNTGGKCAYRGPWMMETVAREQMADLMAAELGLDPLEFRRRNVITADQLPYTTATGLTYEAVTPAETLDQAAELIGHDEFRREQAAAREQGRLLGLGYAVYIEGSPGFGILGAEQVTVRIDPGGKALVFTGSGNHGQSLETTFAQIVAENLGVDVDDVRVVQGDTDSAPFGFGTGGSRSSWLFGAAAKGAAEQLRAKVLAVAAVALEANAADLEMTDGVVTVKGNPQVALPLPQVAGFAYGAHAMMPADMEPGLEASYRFKAPLFQFSNAAHAVTVEIDPQTGEVKILRYVVSEDCGNMINPMVVEGQIAGGVVQGIGGVFYENFVYDDNGNPLTTTFLDYLLPTAAEVPDIEYGHVITPSTTPGGFKPMGEGGAIVAPPALLNAVQDALAPFGARVTTQPVTPEVVLDLIAAGSR